MSRLDQIRRELLRVDRIVLRGQSYQIADRAYRLRSGQVTDAPVQVQTNLASQDLFRATQLIQLTSLLQEGEVKLVSVTAENLPGHLDVAVGGNIDWGRWRRLPERETKTPSDKARFSGECRSGP
jgi:hypothetical protein